MGWKDKLRREYMEADREFIEGVLPVGSVDRAAFGLIAEATRYLLVEEAGEVHLRAEIAAADEILTSLARSGLAVSAKDARAAVARYAERWEEVARRRGTWGAAVAQARQDGDVRHAPSPGRKPSWWDRLRRGSAPR